MTRDDNRLVEELVARMLEETTASREELAQYATTLILYAPVPATLEES